MVEVVGGNAHSVVGDRGPDLGRCDASLDHHGAPAPCAGLNGLRGIPDEVDKDLLQLVCVGLHDGVRIGMQDEANPLGVGTALHELGRITDDLFQCHSAPKLS